jgi:hypothetical protein
MGEQRKGGPGGYGITPSPRIRVKTAMRPVFSGPSLTCMKQNGQMTASACMILRTAVGRRLVIPCFFSRRVLSQVLKSTTRQVIPPIVLNRMGIRGSLNLTAEEKNRSPDITRRREVRRENLISPLPKHDALTTVDHPFRVCRK